MAPSLLTLTLVIAVGTAGVRGFELRIAPRQATVRLEDKASILCRANVPLDRCRFLLPGGRVVDLSRGPSSPVTDQYRYYGRGLHTGQCGITLTRLNAQSFSAIACQGHTAREGWRWASMFLRVTNLSTIQWDIDLQQGPVLTEGQNASFLCLTDVPLSTCRFGFIKDDEWLDLSLGPVSKRTSEYAYFGAGLEAGQCGVTLFNVGREASQELRCVGIGENNEWVGDFFSIVVAKSPQSPQLSFSSSSYRDGDTLSATCTVSGGRPTPEVTWSLGGEPVHDVITDESPGDAWFDHEEQTVVQRLNRRVSCRDHGKALQCRAAGRQTDQQIQVSCGSGPASDTVFPPVEGSSPATDIVRPDPRPPPSVLRPDTRPPPSTPAVRPDTPAAVRPVSRPQQGVGRPPSQGQPGDRPRPTNSPPSCGVPLLSTQLIVNGEETVEGHWPWIAAIFVKKFNKGGLEFLCGGTLVHARHVVTAAHCVTRSGVKRRPDDMVVFLGKHNLNEWAEPNSQLKRVDSVHVASGFVSPANGSDIAVLRLSSAATFTEYVRPACLWDKGSDLEDVVGYTGAVVGWGRFGPGEAAVSDAPRLARTSIVSQEECLRSHPDFVKVTTKDTFCAGLRDGSGPCNGDSGSGLVVLTRGAAARRIQWFLRGVVSLALGRPTDGACDLSQYVVYTDVAKYSAWLHRLLRSP